MAAPVAQTNSKQPKKKVKAGDAVEAPAPIPDSPVPEQGIDGDDESPYIKELQKTIRNLNKKIVNASKTDAVLAEHVDKSLDDLIATKLINADQKALILKKPVLQAQVAQLEDQLVQYKKLDAEYRSRSIKEKADFEKTLTETSENGRVAAVREARQAAEMEHNEAMNEKFLVLSQFLRLAAARRTEDADPSLDENLALEGVLLAIYTGDENAVSTILKLVNGVEEKTANVSGEALEATYAQVKAAAQAYKTPLFTTEDDIQAPESESPAKIESDAIDLDAGLPEIQANESVPPANVDAPVASRPGTSNFEGNSAANISTEGQWDTGNDMGMSISQEWVSVPRDDTETELATPTAAVSVPPTPSWADDQPEPPSEQPAPADANDGFHQVHRNRGRGERDSGWRGRGRGESRGRSYYNNRGGEMRGRGRGPRGPPTGRAPRRNDERRVEES